MFSLEKITFYRGYDNLQTHEALLCECKIIIVLLDPLRQIDKKLQRGHFSTN